MKKIFKDENEKRAAILTVLTMFVLFLWMFFHTAFSYQDPPEEYGMEVNFGTTDFGQGDNQTTEPIQMSPDGVDEPQDAETPEEPSEDVPQEETPEEDVPQEDTPAEETSTEQVPTDNTMTDDTVEDVPTMTKSETPQKPAVDPKPNEETKPVAETKPNKPVKKSSTRPKSSRPKRNTKSADNAFSNMLKGKATKGSSSGSEGDDNKNGDKGHVNGDPNAPGYYTNPGNGSGGDYDLIGRIPLKRPLPVYSCMKEGRVVVSIQVDRQGKVISATPGAKGSTTTDPCLLKRAKEAALKTKWQAAGNAPEKHVGKIVYNFSLQ